MVEHESDGDTSCHWCSQNGSQSLGKRLVVLETGGRDEISQGTAKVGQNTEMSPGDLGWLTVAQTPVNDHQRTLMWKALKEWNNEYNMYTYIST